jgi:hypothetical protein
MEPITRSEIEINSDFRIAEFRVIINTDEDDESDSSVMVTRRQIQHYGWDALHTVVRHYPVDKLIDIVRLLSDLEIEKSSTLFDCFSNAGSTSIVKISKDVTQLQLQVD